MGGEPVRIGPFVGGMNTYSGSSSIADNEAVLIQNMDVDLDGSLTSRPGIKQASAPVAQIGTVIGIYRSKVNTVYMIYAFDTATYALDTSTDTWILINAAKFTACVQYKDILWLVKPPAGTTQGGSKWDPVGGHSAVATMPRGFSACIYKERMFISASREGDETSINRVKFSNPGMPETWDTLDFFDVSGGDGQDITYLYSFDSSIVIFKTDSTFVTAYESSPSKALTQRVSGTIGANNARCIVEYEGSLFVMHENNVYRIGNWNWEHANIKIPFTYKNTHSTPIQFDTSLSLVGNRLIARYYDNYYTLGMKTGAWAVWQFGNDFTPTEFTGNPNLSPTDGVVKYYAACYVASKAHYYTLRDIIDTTPTSETYPIKLVSKSYDFGPSYSFKRLYWWGVDLLSKSNTTFKVNPVVYYVPVTWGQVGAVPISDLETWGRPLDISIDVTDSADASNPSNFRTFTKLLKSLRFRQAAFTIESVADGTASTGPYRIFSLTAFVDSKETVSKKVA